MPVIKAHDRLGYEYEVKVSRQDAHLARYKWRICSRGYAYRQTSVCVKPRSEGPPKALKLYMHREICGLPVGDLRVADHKNRCKLDNRRSNLEVVSFAENMRRWMEQDGGAGVMLWE